VKKPEVTHSPEPTHTPEHKEALVGAHLKSADELISLPKFPAGTKSLLAKYLTPEIWEKLNDEKDKFGFTFKLAIFSGCKNTDSGIGVYAGSHDSYAVFSDLFDKIIGKYHGHEKGAKHVSDMDYSKLECPPFIEAEAALIKSTRIRVGRNLADYPLGPGLTKEQRKEVETKVV
jgi:creatine kinase/arginine kinase